MVLWASLSLFRTLMDAHAFTPDLEAATFPKSATTACAVKIWLLQLASVASHDIVWSGNVFWFCPENCIDSFQFWCLKTTPRQTSRFVLRTDFWFVKSWYFFRKTPKQQQARCRWSCTFSRIRSHMFKRKHFGYPTKGSKQNEILKRWHFNRTGKPLNFFELCCLSMVPTRTSHSPRCFPWHIKNVCHVWPILISQRISATKFVLATSQTWARKGNTEETITREVWGMFDMLEALHVKPKSWSPRK